MMWVCFFFSRQTNQKSKSPLFFQLDGADRGSRSAKSKKETRVDDLQKKINNHCDKEINNRYIRASKPPTIYIYLYDYSTSTIFKVLSSDLLASLHTKDEVENR